MTNPNNTARTVLRWTHLLAGWLIGVFVYTPARESEALVLLMQAAVVLTGVWMWQQARIRHLFRRLCQNPRRNETNGPEPPERTRGNAEGDLRARPRGLLDDDLRGLGDRGDHGPRGGQPFFRPRLRGGPGGAWQGQQGAGRAHGAEARTLPTPLPEDEGRVGPCRRPCFGVPSPPPLHHREGLARHGGHPKTPALRVGQGGPPEKDRREGARSAPGTFGRTPAS